MLEVLNGLEEPYFHVILATDSDFYDATLTLKEQGQLIVRHIRGSKCRSVTALFDEFSAVLQFPYYFGGNLSAFDECLNDLEWLPGEGYVLLISNANEFLINDERDFDSIIEILHCTAREWVEGRDFDDFPTQPTPFHIVFHCSSQQEKEVLCSKLLRAGVANVGLLVTTQATPPGI